MRKVGGAKGAASVMLVGLDNDAMGMVREVLGAEAVLPSASISFGDALQNAKRGRPDVVIVGFSAQGMDAALGLAQALAKEAPKSTLVALAKQSDPQAILSAMRAGYKEFVVLPDDATRLRQAVHQAAFREDTEQESGLVVSLLGAKGGVGTTMLATHLTAELAAIHRVLLLDLDFSMGDVASMLDVTPKDTMADILPRADRLDERMLTGAAAVHRTKAHVLAQPNDLAKVTTPQTEDVYNVINAAASAYMYVLIDAGCHVDEAVGIALSVSDIVVLVATPDVVSVRDAFRRLKHLETLGIESERIRLVVNRARKGAFVSDEDIAANLGLKVSVSVGDDPKTVDQAINEGKLIREIARKSEVAQDISKLVALVAEDHDGEPDKDEEPASKGGFFFGLFGRG